MIDPIAFQIGPLAVRWYGIAYIVSLMLAIWIVSILNKKPTQGGVFKDNNQIFDFAFWIFLLGVLLGGRLGYILFYNLPFYLEQPAKIFAVWQGGMSFHGGLIGATLVTFFLIRKHKMDMLKTMDLIAVPAGLMTVFSRLANFINQELYGRMIENPNWEWLGVDFGDGLLRYPSQLFQSAGSLILFLILLFIFSRKPKKGVATFSYFILYGLIRLILEFWREPDAQIGFLFKFLTMGQLLSLAMVVFGLGGLIWVKKRKKEA